MSERTGATERQLEAAINRAAVFGDPQSEWRAEAMTRMATFAKFLVPPTARIVEDWPAAEAALRAMKADLNYVTDLLQQFGIVPRGEPLTTDAHRARIDALIGDER